MDPVGKRIFIRSRSIPLVALDLSGRRQAPDNLNNDAPDYYSWHDETHAFSNYNFLVMAEQSETELAENTKFNIFLDEWVQKHSDINVRTAGTEILYERAHELFLSPVAYKESLLAPDMDKILSESRAFADKITPLDRQTWWNQSTFQAAVFLIQAGVDAYIKQYGPPPCWRTDKPSRIFGR